MNNPTQPRDTVQTLHTEAMHDALFALKGHNPETDEYTQIVKNLETLNKVKPDGRAPVQWDTILTVGANILGIVVVLSYEQLHVIPGKAFGMISKLKL